MEPRDSVNLVRLGDVMTAIAAERVRQDVKWGAAHDYTHSGIEWAGLISHYAGRVATDGQSVEAAQQALIKAAAICVAAIQAMALWQYGPNAAAALNALQTEISRLSDPLPEPEQTADEDGRLYCPNYSCETRAVEIEEAVHHSGDGTFHCPLCDSLLESMPGAGTIMKAYPRR